MNRDIYDYLYHYFDKTTNSTDKQRENLNKHFKTINRLLNENILSDGLADLLIDDMCKVMQYVLKIISDCPYLEIHIRKVYKNIPQPRTPRQKTNIDAIGFEYNPVDEELDIDD